nr:AMIN domain-containing protein [uncultured Desulfobulbus sp.]
MNTHILTHLSRSVLILLLTLGLTFAKDSPRLEQIKHSVLSPGSEQITLQLNGSYSPKIFTLKGQSPRIVLDFTGMSQGRGVNNQLKVNGTWIQGIRVGVHGGDTPKTRVVFDMKTLKGVTYSQQYDAKTSTLRLTFTGPEKGAAVPKTAVKAPSEIPEKKTVEAKPQPAPKTPPKPAPQPAAAEAAAAPQGIRSAPQAGEATKAVEPKPAKTEAKTEAKPEPQKPAEQAAAETVKPAKDDKKAQEKLEPPKNAPQAEKPTVSQPAEKPAETQQEAVSPRKEPAAATEPSPEPEIVAAPVSKDPVLESVKFDASSPKGEMVMFKLNGFYPPSVHGVEEGIPRVFCDFNNTTLTDKSKKRIRTEGKFVKAIRISTTKKPEKVRVVIDLEPNRSYDLQQVFFKDDNLFVIIVNTIKK